MFRVYTYKVCHLYVISIQFNSYLRYCQSVSSLSSSNTQVLWADQAMAVVNFNDCGNHRGIKLTAASPPAAISMPAVSWCVFSSLFGVGRGIRDPAAAAAAVGQSARFH